MGGSVGLIIGSSDGGFDDDFFLMGLLQWVSNRRRGFLIGGFVGLMAWVFDRCGFDGLCLCLCVWLRKTNTVKGEVEGEGCG